MKLTPFYERDGITIYCGECSEVMSQWDADSIDLTVTSPPYDNLRTYNGYTFDFERIAGELWRVTKPGGIVVWAVGDATVDGSETLTSFRQAIYFRSLGFNVETMIYEAAGTGAKGSNDYYWQAFEFMFVFVKGKPKTTNLIEDKKNNTGGQKKWSSAWRNQTIDKVYEVKEYGRRTNIWTFRAGSLTGDDFTGHPAPFPEALARDHIISWSNPGDLVCDPMLGSGTTCKMAQQLGRRFIGCEISEDYCRIAVDRLRQPSFFSLPIQPAAKVEPEQTVMAI